jgi:hypothetical protein
MKLFCYYRSPNNNFFWFRILGYGLVIKNTNVYPLLFSERMGLRKTYKIKNWSISKLKP